MGLIWFIPLFMTWQKERVQGSVDDQKYSDACNGMQTLVMEILGAP